MREQLQPVFAGAGKLQSFCHEDQFANDAWIVKLQLSLLHKKWLFFFIDIDQLQPDGHFPQSIGQGDVDREDRVRERKGLSRDRGKRTDQRVFAGVRIAPTAVTDDEGQC